MTHKDQLIDSFTSTSHGDGNYKGLTKREYFAAMALQGIISSNESGVGHHPTTAAEWAVSLADALIDQLNKTP